MKDKERIKDWIKNLKSQASTIPNLGINALAGFQLACDEVITFINSIPECPASEDLEGVKTMSDKEKAKEIAEVSQILSDFPHDYHSVEYGAIKMAKWKDEQLKEQIEKACEWLEHNFNMPNDFRKHFKKAMEE